jgi:Mlc titration factor MtfA (ptsG expression regulator)
VVAKTWVNRSARLRLNRPEIETKSTDSRSERALFRWLLRNRRQRLLAKPFPLQWETWLHHRVLHYRMLDERERASLRIGVRVIVAEKYWEGCSGLVVTDEMKVAIAGQASLMLLGIEHDFFGAVNTILIYPSTFRIGDERDQLDGQSHHRGPVILSWDRVYEDGTDLSSPDNLVIHEFAHQLDEMDGFINGTPYLPNQQLADRWHAAMNLEFNRLVDNLNANRESFLGDYAATDDAEFFSVASERIFMQPNKLQRLYPSLFQLLADFYRVDPRKWFDRLKSS